MNSSNLEAEIAAMESRLCQAILSNDITELAELIDDEVLFVGPDGQMVTKAMDLESHRTRLLQMHQMDLLEQQFRVLGEIVVAVSKYTLGGIFAGGHFDGDFRYSRVWQKNGDSWRIVAGHCNSIED